MSMKVIGNKAKWRVKVCTSIKLIVGIIRVNGAKARWFPEALSSTTKKAISLERLKITRNQAKAPNIYRMVIFTKAISKKANTMDTAFCIQIRASSMLVISKTVKNMALVYY